MPRRAEVDPAKVAEIKDLYAGGVTKLEIARLVGVSDWIVRRALDPHLITREAERGRRRSATPEQKEYIHRYYDNDAHRARMKRVMRVKRGYLDIIGQVDDAWGNRYNVVQEVTRPDGLRLCFGSSVDKGVRLGLILTAEVVAHLRGREPREIDFPISMDNIRRKYRLIAWRDAGGRPEDRP